MLRVTTIHAHAAGHAARYYTRYLADDGPEGEGVWLGGQADGLGLAGPVSTEGLEALLSGRDPVTGTRLGAELVDRVDAKGRLIRAVAGFDATFSAPKSLSVWWGLTGDPGLLEAHDLAVRAALAHVERYGATTRVRVNGARQHPDGRGLVMASFRQATSREDDPQLHSHVVISAKVQSPDGRWLALDARYLKRKQRALGGLYQSVLRAELTHRYGVRWGPIVKGQAEIAGVPEELLDAFSKRARQVDELLAAKVGDFREREGRDPTRWERAALTREAAADSRDNKTHTSTGALSSRWDDEARSMGWTPDRVVASMRAAARDAPPVEPTLRTSDVLEQLSALGSSWTRADVVGAICDLAPAVSQLSGQDWARAVDRACDQVIDSCETLDPPAPGPVRTSDGRSVWLPPSEPYLTHEHVLAQEERILTFAIDAHDQPEAPSSTLDRSGLDVLQADAAAAVAGRDRLVLVVGPAGTGKTTALRAAVDDLGRQRRPVFGVAPTAKAAKVLRQETGMPADTIAKLLHEWRSGDPGEAYQLPAGSSLVVDEAGMCGTATLDDVVRLAVSQRWRLVLVGDPRQLQAVGRGGMFDELCGVGRTHELTSVHRFRHQWEQRASLQLRAGNPEGLHAYFQHRRVTPGSFDDLTATIAEQWIDHTARGRSVAVVAETNDHVDALNAAIQRARRDAGQLGGAPLRVAAGETAAFGDIVVTRRNDRSLRTDRGEPIRNRDRWTVIAVNRDRSLAVVTEATSHRSLYVAATRGRDENRLFVVTDDAERARDILERVLTSERADVPAVAQRRNLARKLPPTREADNAVTEAQRAVEQARVAAEPVLRPLRTAETERRAAERELLERRRALEETPKWRRRGMASQVRDAADALGTARSKVHALERAAAPHVALIDAAEHNLHQAEHDARLKRIKDRLDHLALEPTSRTIERGVEIEPPGLGR